MDSILARPDIRSCRRPGVVGTPCFRENRVVMPLLAAIDRSEERLAGDELVDVAVRSPEVLPGRSWFAEQLDAGVDGHRDLPAGGHEELPRVGHRGY
jgi:hypothetical protein